MKPLPRATADSTQISWPFARWFVYLFIGILLTLSEACSIEHPEDKVHAVDVQTFHEVDGKLAPTSEKIWLDVTAYKKLRSGRWLTLALGVFALDFILTLAFRGWWGFRSNSETDVALAVPVKYES